MFKIGKIGFGICMMLMGLAAMTDFFERSEELEEYYQF
jgi:Na+/phosphate symporter